MSVPEELQSVLVNTDRVVIKVGTSCITHDSGKLNLGRMDEIVREIADIANQSREVILVTSGAVGAGMGKLGWKTRPRTLPEKQAAAAVGQGILLHMYEKMFAEYGHTVAQVLLTREDLAHRKRYLNARHTLNTLLKFNVIPIINENDTVAVEEIKLGDNDNLAALVAGLLSADLLIMVSDIDGLYTSDPRQNTDAELISVIEEITPQIEQLASGSRSETGTGGMITKIQAARICMSSGVFMIIVNGFNPGSLKIFDSGFQGTVFKPRLDKLAGRKRWIAFGSDVQGELDIDEGAEKALLYYGRSLLAIGVKAVKGNFEKGAVVSVVRRNGEEIARGIVNYDASEIERIKSKKSSAIFSILGYKDYDEVIHRDNLVIK